MNTIENKKGNVGYLITPWNFSQMFKRDENGRWTVPAYSQRPTRNIKTGELEEYQTMQFMIEKVRVHSSGKKVMRLFSFDDGKIMKGREFAPTDKIYETFADAVKAAEKEYEEIKKQIDKPFSVTTLDQWRESLK